MTFQRCRNDLIFENYLMRMTATENNGATNHGADKLSCADLRDVEDGAAVIGLFRWGRFDNDS
jgi:hypothetical protein